MRTDCIFSCCYVFAHKGGIYSKVVRRPSTSLKVFVLFYRDNRKMWLARLREVVGDLDLLVLLNDGVELGAPRGHALDDLLRRLGSEAPVVFWLAHAFPEVYPSTGVPKTT